MRWAYIKNGDAVAQIDQVGASPSRVPEGGPDAFFADLLSNLAADPLLIISCSKRAAIFSDGRVVARVFRLSPVMLGGPGRLARILYASVMGGLMLLRYRPQRMICGRVGALLRVSYIVAVILRIPWIHSRHNSIDRPGAGLLQRLSAAIDKALIRRAHAVICHGPFLAREAREFGVAEDRVFEFDVGYKDYVATARRSELPQELAGLNGRKIVFVGRVESGKGVFDLLEAAAGLLADNEDLSLIYVGNGSDIERLREQVAARGLGRQVIITGPISHARTAAVVAGATIAVTPTRSEFPEGRCMSAMEALVLGKPLVAPALGPFPFLVKHDKNGLLYTADSVTELASALQRLLTDAELFARLQAGAESSGRQLLTPEHTFFDAVQRGFGDNQGA